MGDIIYGYDFRRSLRKGSLREIGLRIIASKEFQAAAIGSDKEQFPFDPVSVAIMNGYGDNLSGES